jgi:hypothetical protein
MTDPRIRFRGVCLFVREADSLVVVFPRTTGGPGTCTQRGLHHPNAVKWKADGTHEAPVNLVGRVVEAGSGTGITHQLDNVLNMGAILGSTATLKPLQIGPDIVTIVRLTAGNTISLRPADEEFVIEDVTGQPSNQPSLPDLEVAWTAEGGANIVLAGPGISISATADEEIIIGHFDREDHAKAREIEPKQCDPGTPKPLQDVDFSWLYQLFRFSSTRRPVPTQAAALAGPLTSTCFGSTWP